MKRILIATVLLFVFSSMALAEPAAGKVTLDRTYFLLRRDTSFVLHATVSPPDASQEVRWSSSKPQILSVEQDGTVYAIGQGSAVITAEAMDGSGKKAKCTVNVLKAYVTDVILTADRYTLDESVETSFTLGATVLPSYAGVKSLRWKSSDENVATVRNGKVTMKQGLGNTKVITVTAEATDASGVEGKCEVTVDPVVYRAFITRTGEGTSGMQHALGTLDKSPYHVYTLSLTEDISRRLSATDSNDVTLFYIAGDASGEGLVLPDGSLLQAEALSEMWASVSGHKVILIDVYSEDPTGFCDRFIRKLSPSDLVFITAGPDRVGERIFALGAGWNTVRGARASLSADRNRDKKVTWTEYCQYLSAQFEKEAKAAGTVRSTRFTEPYDLVLFSR